MIRVQPDVLVRFALEPVDFRKSIDGLACAVGAALGRDPLSGEMFVFCNRDRSALKALLWSTGGFVLVYKRLERGRFSLPSATTAAGDVVLPPSVLNDLLAGAARAMEFVDNKP
jgi:transposase